VDEHEAGGTGGPSSGDEAGAEHDRGPVNEYTWEGRPGEDFGPIAPPPPRPRLPSKPPTPDERPASGPDDRPAAGPDERSSPDEPPSSGLRRPHPIATDLPPDDETDTDRIPVLTRNRPSEPEPTERQPRVSFVPTAASPRRRRWRPILTAIGALILVVGLAAAMLTVISRQALESGTREPGAATGTEASPVAQAPLASPAVTSSPQATPAPTQQAATVPSPARTASPTPLALAPPTASPAPTRSPVAASRATPAIVPTLSSIFVTPPGLRFATSTPARIGTPFPTRTPPPIPTLRPITFSSRVWSDQVLHHVGDDALICASATNGARAQMTVIAPDRSTRTLGELQPPAERVCYSMHLDDPGLYVMTLIITDAAGTEIDRQSGVLSADR
jgi:hypothetical protein